MSGKEEQENGKAPKVEELHPLVANSPFGCQHIETAEEEKETSPVKNR